MPSRHIRQAQTQQVSTRNSICIGQSFQINSRLCYEAGQYYLLTIFVLHRLDVYDSPQPICEKIDVFEHKEKGH